MPKRKKKVVELTKVVEKKVIISTCDTKQTLGYCRTREVQSVKRDGEMCLICDLCGSKL